MRARRFVCASVIAGAFACAPSTAAAQESPQALRQEIDQLRKDFEALKQQYGDRLTALETKLASAEGTPPPAAPPAQPPTAAAAGAARLRRCRPAPRAQAVPAARCRCTVARSRARRSSTRTWPSSATFSAPPARNDVNPSSGDGDARIRGIAPGRRRSVRARRFLHLLRRGRGRSRRGIPDVDRRCPAGC